MPMMEPDDDEPKWLKTLYLASWVTLWLFVALTMLGCLFGCMLYNWEG